MRGPWCRMTMRSFWRVSAVSRSSQAARIRLHKDDSAKLAALGLVYSQCVGELKDRIALFAKIAAGEAYLKPGCEENSTSSFQRKSGCPFFQK